MNLKQLLLIKLMEECAEVQHACAKALRFGTKDSEICDSGTNLDRLKEEILDLLAVLEMLDEHKVLEYPAFDFRDTKLADRVARINKYMQYSKELGILVDEHII